MISLAADTYRHSDSTVRPFGSLESDTVMFGVSGLQVLLPFLQIALNTHCSCAVFDRTPA